MALQTFYPEMHEVPAGTEIVARLNSFSGKWRLKTVVDISCKGVSLECVKDCGSKIYTATSAAFKKVCEKYSVASEILL
jgi:hypothetical protein